MNTETITTGQQPDERHDQHHDQRHNQHQGDGDQQIAATESAAVVVHDEPQNEPQNVTHVEPTAERQKRSHKKGTSTGKRRANGSKGNDGLRRRRKNGTGTIDLRKDGYTILYYNVIIDGRKVRKSKSLGKNVPIEEARKQLDELSGGGIFTRERQLQKTVAELSGVRAEIEAKKKAEAEERAKAEAEERDARAIKIADAWPFYVASKKRPDSGARTLDGYEAQYRTFARWCADNHADKPLMRDFTPELAEAFIDHIEKSRSRTTRNKYIVLLRTFWRVMRWNADAQLTVDPWEGIRTLTATPDVVTRRDITVEELVRICEYLRTDESKSICTYIYNPKDGRKNSESWDLRGEMISLVALGLYLGARLGDCVTLQWGAVDLALGTISYQPRKTARKYKRSVTAPIHPALGRMLANVPTEERRGYLLPKLATIYLEREPSGITNRFQAILRAVGIETTANAPDVEGGGTRARVACGFHSIRHFFAAWLDNHGVNHALTNYLTCHEQGKVEATYYHGNREALAAAVATLPTIPTDARPDAITNTATAETTATPATTPDARGSRYRAFCEIVRTMDADELKVASDFILKTLKTAEAH